MVKASRSARQTNSRGKPSLLHRLHDWANHYEGILLLLLLVLILRLPSLAEPYWYGDEAIYLTIGNALRHGQRLYAEIVDHKTPLIYYFAAVPNQFWFRILMLGWMLTTTTFFYRVAQRFLINSKLAWISSLLFVLLTSWSSLEGNIPNGELFVMGFMLAALDLLTQTTFYRNFVKQEHRQITRRDYLLAFVAGVVSSGGILTKVPGLFDVAAMGSVFIWLVLLGFLPLLTKKPGRHPDWLTNLKGGSVMLLGVVLPLVLSVIYYWSRGSLDAYFQFGLLYNFHYTGNWTPPLDTAWLQFLFTLPGKGLILLGGFFLSTWLVFTQPKHRRFVWVGWWLWLALFAALLSNRPYPHYFQQIVPPLALLAVIWFLPKMKWLTRISLLLPAGLAGAALVLLGFRLYPFIPYYTSYLKLTTGSMSQEAYARSFNSLVQQNDQLAEIIVRNSDPEDYLFIWGTNPMLYALTQRVPASRFTVAFHIHDLQVYQETLDEIQHYKPTYIVVMKQESEWPELEDYLDQHYLYSAETSDMVLYRRSTLTSLLLIE